MSRRTLLPLTALLITAMVPLTTSCSRGKTVQANTGSDLPTVAVAKASFQPMTRGLVLTAEFKPFQEIDVMAKVAGYVKEIRVDVGDRVQQGELLATLEIPEMADDLARSKATLDRSSAEVRRSQEELQRAKSAHEMTHLSYSRLASVMKDRPGLIAQQEVDDAHSRDLVSEAQVAAARSSLDAAQEQVKVAQAEQAKVKTLLNYTRVTAPFTGVVTKRFADTGSMIQAGTSSQTQAMPLVRLSENRKLRLILPVPESAVSHIRVGSVVEVRVPSLKRSFPGKVARFAERVRTDTRTMETEVDVENPSLMLVPGMYAEADLTLESRKEALAIPVSAVVGTESDHRVYALTPDHHIEIRKVVIGLETATLAEVKSGLGDGDMVVIGSRSGLLPGQHVTPKVTELMAQKSE